MVVKKWPFMAEEPYMVDSFTITSRNKDRHPFEVDKRFKRTLELEMHRHNSLTGRFEKYKIAISGREFNIEMEEEYSA